MSTIPAYNLKGTASSKLPASKELFEVVYSEPLVHQVVRILMLNKRQNIAHTKDRSEVRGGGRKPWKQKGTGRARHGSSRSPIWAGGGITFGPRNEENYSKSIPKKMKRAAMHHVLSMKLKNDHVAVLEDVTLEKPSTSTLRTFLSTVFPKGSTLLVTAESHPVMVRSLDNVPRASVTHVEVMNILDLVNTTNVVFTKDALKKLEEKYTT